MGAPLGHNSYKIRLAIKSKRNGKSGARVITYLESEIILDLEISSELTVVNLISIYDKSSTESIPDKELIDLINNMEF